MTRSIIFVGGVHGVGKTYLCKSLEESLSFKHYSASQLIKSLKDDQSVSIDKRVANIDGNQQLLLTAISEYIKPDVTAVLDGHFCLLNNKKKIEHIPVEIFSCISPISLIVLHDSIENIGNRISGRDGVRYDYELLTTFQEKEIEYSQYIAQHLHIPSGPCQQVYNDLVVDEMHKIHHEVNETYGSPRMAVELRKRGYSRCENTVARLMQAQGIRAKMDKRYKPRQWQKGSKIAKKNLLAAMPLPPRPHEVWVADFTYTCHRGQFVYFSTIMDLCTRQIVGEDISKTRDAELIVRTFRKARRKYPETRPKIFHSDRGIEYANYKVGKMLEKQSIEQSMSGKGNCYDNAHMESFFHTYKSEMYYTEKFDDLEDFKIKTKQYLRFYNKKRLHSSLRYMSPADYAKSKA